MKVQCEIYPKLQEVPGYCALLSCNKPLPPRRRKWCSDKCVKYYRRIVDNNHDWNSARKAAKKRDGYKCVKCGKGKEAKLEVNHKTPLVGSGYGFSCNHHLDGLETLCHSCHVEVTNEQRRLRKVVPCGNET